MERPERPLAGEDNFLPEDNSGAPEVLLRHEDVLMFIGDPGNRVFLWSVQHNSPFCYNPTQPSETIYCNGQVTLRVWEDENREQEIIGNNEIYNHRSKGLNHDRVVYCHKCEQEVGVMREFLKGMTISFCRQHDLTPLINTNNRIFLG